MHTTPPKKLMIINILDILKRCSDENHRLSQKDILEILENEYSMKADRKAVKRNLINLLESPVKPMKKVIGLEKGCYQNRK